MRIKKYLCGILALLLLFSGCSSGKEPERAQLLREYYAGLTSCTITAHVTADFGDKTQEFTLKMKTQADGQTTVEVLAPEEIAGITARISPGGGQLIYDDVILETGSLPGGGITPVDALPTMLGVWARGYLQEAGEEKLDGVKALHLVWRNMVGETEILHHGWFDRDSFKPLRAEVLSNNEMVIVCEFELFEA